MNIPVNVAGLHPTTVSCLEALQWLKEQRQFQNILDMGCGSGILSLAAAGMWQARVTAADISEQAITDTQNNIDAQKLAELVTPVRSDGFRHPMIRDHSPYDLIIFNLLAEPIVQMAPEVVSHLSDGGICLLSGILMWLAPDVETTYRQNGFELMQSFPRAPWQTLVMRHPIQPSAPSQAI
jgi:ribosomal protein L11 methyltransferase